MSVEGIFRKNGNIRRLKELSEAIDKNPASINLADEYPVQVAALLKKFLRDLPDPLLTFKLHRLFVCSQSMYLSLTHSVQKLKIPSFWIQKLSILYLIRGFVTFDRIGIRGSKEKSASPSVLPSP